MELRVEVIPAPDDDRESEFYELQGSFLMQGVDISFRSEKKSAGWDVATKAI